MSELTIGNSLILDTDYSESEVKTGATWIDGKPIYRKVFEYTIPTFTSPSGVVTVTIGTISDKKNVANISAILDNNGAETMMPYLGWGSWSSSQYPQTNGTRIDVNSVGQVNLVYAFSWTGLIGAKVRVTVEYTKTTD